MKTAHELETQTDITWHAAAGVQPVVFVAKSGGRPVAILQLRPGIGFELTTCSGQLIGDFPSLESGKSALAEWMTQR